MRYDFSATLWRAEAAAAWHFLTLPKDVSQQIRTIAALNPFGSLRVRAVIGANSWRTSLFADAKAGAFLLPVKADVRRKAKLEAGDTVAASVELEL